MNGAGEHSARLSGKGSKRAGKRRALRIQCADKLEETALSAPAA